MTLLLDTLSDTAGTHTIYGTVVHVLSHSAVTVIGTAVHAIVLLL